MRNGSNKTSLAGMGGFFPGGPRGGGGPEHPGLQSVVERGEGRARADGTAFIHGLPVFGFFSSLAKVYPSP